MVAIIAGLGAIALGVWTLLKETMQWVWNFASMFFTFVYRMINLTFAALPMPLKFLYGLGLMFITSSLIINATFGITNLCCDPDMGYDCEAGKVYETSPITGIAYTIRNMVDSIQLFGNKAHSVEDFQEGVSEVNEGNYGTYYATTMLTQKELEFSDLFLMPTSDNYRKYDRDTYTTCNVHSAYSTDYQKRQSRMGWLPNWLATPQVYYCWQDVTICKTHGDTDDSAWSDDYGQMEGRCYAVIDSYNVPDPMTGQILSEDSVYYPAGYDFDGIQGGNPCRQTYNFHTGAGYYDPNIFQSIGDTIQCWFGFCQYTDEMVTRGSFVIPNTDPQHTLFYWDAYHQDSFAAVLEEECGSETYNEPDVNPGDEGTYWSTPGTHKPVFFWWTDMILISQLEAWDEQYNDGMMFYKVKDAEKISLEQSVSDFAKSGTTEITKSIEKNTNIFNPSNLKDAEEGELEIFSSSCKATIMDDGSTDYELQIGLFGIQEIFALKTFLVFAALWAMASIVGFVHK